MIFIILYKIIGIQNLEKRTLKFAIRVRKFALRLPEITAIFEDEKQVIRSSGSVGANYIEANEKLGLKDLSYRKKIARKEAKRDSLLAENHQRK